MGPDELPIQGLTPLLKLEYQVLQRKGDGRAKEATIIIRGDGVTQVRPDPGGDPDLPERRIRKVRPARKATRGGLQTYPGSRMAELMKIRNTAT